MSHDLKAPLRAIESASRWIEEDMGQDGLPAHIREFLGLMRQRVRRMENLIAGILELARVGRTAEADEKVFVRQLLREITDSIAPPAGFHIELPFFLPTLTTNRVQLQQVFTNLLSNAIKYHDHPEVGRVTIACGEAGAFYQFSVADDGPTSPRNTTSGCSSFFKPWSSATPARARAWAWPSSKKLWSGRAAASA